MRMMHYRRAGNACVRALCAALALFALLLGVHAAAETDGMLRVKLARLGAPSEIAMRADCDYYVVGEPLVQVPSGTEILVSASDGSLTLTADGNTVELGASVRLARDAAGDHGVAFLSPTLSNRFCGDLDLTASGDTIAAVLNIYVEDFLRGVVGCEMPPSSGAEALKAQAIVARNYALLCKSSRAGSAYDLSDSGDALSFRGCSDSDEYSAVLRAVEDTRGQVLFFGDSPAACYFCDSNGGQTESSDNAFGRALAYTQVMDDPYDLDGSGVKKSVSLRRDASDLPEALEAALIDGAAAQLAQQGNGGPTEVRIDAIEDIVPESPRFPEPSRLYRSLAFTLTLSGIDEPVTVHVPTYGGIEQWCSLAINDEDNETVWVSHSAQAFEITFRRDGSGVGMSKRGAQAMAKKGLDCQTILDYYYPGTELRRLELSDASGEVASAREASAHPIATARLSQKSRLYQQADTSSGVQTTLPAGATVTVYAVKGEWAAIGSGELYGFIHTDALASFALTGVTVAQVQNETFAQVGGDRVQVLQLPVSTASVVETLAGATTVQLNAYSDEWALVTTPNGTEGFIPRNALTLRAGDSPTEGEFVSAQKDLYGLLTEDAGLYVNADDSIAPRQTLEKDGYVLILAYNSAWACVRTADGDTGYVKAACLSAVQQLPTEKPTKDGGAITTVKGKVYRWVSVDALPLYAENSEDSQVLATLKRGDRVRLGAYNDTWACVRSGKVKGFVLLAGLSENASEGAVEGGDIVTVSGTQYATVITSDAALYASPSEAGDPIIRLGEGARVRLGAYNRLWACVRVDGVKGFIRLDALELGATDEAEAASGINYLECDAVTTTAVAMYGDATLDGTPVATLPEGSPIHIYAFDERCAYGECDGLRGFVALRYLKKTS